LGKNTFSRPVKHAPATPEHKKAKKKAKTGKDRKFQKKCDRSKYPKLRVLNLSKAINNRKKEKAMPA